MSTARELPRRIAVVGAGQVGALAAIALRQAVPSSEVIVVGTPPDPGALADLAASALPFTNRLHDRLGIAEETLVRECGASHRLVVRYQRWGGAGQHGLAPYGAAIDPKLKTGFARAWGSDPRNASTSAPAGSLGEVLAVEGHFQPPSGAADSPLAEVDYALRWNGPAYRDLLIREAQRIGVRHASGALGAIEPDGEGGMAALSVGGSPIAADLFVDCTGPSAALLSRLPGAVREDWSGALPIRGLLYGRPGEPMVTLEDRVSLMPVGWLSELAGRDGRQAVLAMVERTTEEAARAALRTEPAGSVLIAPGCAAEPWRGNVVALGDAAAHFEPLAWLNLDLAHRQLALLLDLLPGRRSDPRERAEFNRRAGLMAARVRDLLGAHYAAPGAAAQFAGLTRSPELELALDQYGRRGRLPFWEESPLLTQECSALFDALGFAAGEGPLARAADPREAEAAHAAFTAKAAAALRAVPPYGAWLRGVLQS